MIESENFIPGNSEIPGKNKSESNAVCFYSETGETRRIAEFFAKETGYPLTDITEKDIAKTKAKERETFYYDNLVLCFPVHCQNIPGLVKDFLSVSKIKNLTER